MKFQNPKKKSEEKNTDSGFGEPRAHRGSRSESGRHRYQTGKIKNQKEILNEIFYRPIPLRILVEKLMLIEQFLENWERFMNLLAD